MVNHLYINREQIISILIVVCAVLILFLFPTNTFTESLIALFTFTVIFPVSYLYFVVKKEVFTDFYYSFHFSSKELIASCFALGAGIALMTILFFLPYNEFYIADLQAVFSNFKGFVLYEFLYLLPTLLIAVFFSHIFIFQLDLPQEISVALQIALISTVTITILGLPLIFLVFFGIVCGILSRLRMEKFFLIVCVFFLCFLYFDALIAKSFFA